MLDRVRPACGISDCGAEGGACDPGFACGAGMVSGAGLDVGTV